MAETTRTPESTLKDEPFECPKCGSSNIIKNGGNLVCQNCGFVIEGKSFDRGPEWRAFDQKQWENKSRAGPPRTETRHDKGLSTQIDYKNRDAKGKSLPPERRAQIYRLRKWHKRTKLSGAKDRTLSAGFSEIGRLVSQLGLPKSVGEMACSAFREASDKDMIRGRSVEGIASAIVYLECKKVGLPRTLDEIAKVSYVDKREIDRDQRFLERELGKNPEVIRPTQLVPRFGSELDVSPEVRAKATEIMREIEKRHIGSGKSPSGIAAASLYIACRMAEVEKAQWGIAEVANITEVTLRNLYKEIIEKLGIPKREGKKGTILEIGEWPGEGKTETGKAEVQRVRAKEIKYENVVSSVTFKDTEFDLEKLVKKLGVNKPGDFPGVSYALEGTKATFLIFESGKANCVGTSSASEAKEAPKLLAKRLEEEGFKVDPDPDVEIQNMVIRTDFGTPIDLEALHESPHDTSYDPGSFPGLKLVLDDPDVDFLIFASGQGILHTGREEDVDPAFEKASEILQEFAIGGSWSDEVKELVAWLGESPRYIKVLKAVGEHPKTFLQMAEDFNLEKSTVKEYVSKLAKKSVVEREKNGETLVAITDRGKKVLEFFLQSSSD